MKKIYLILILLFAGLHSYAQTELDTIFRSLQIRQTFETTDGKEAPAQLQVNLPSGGKGNYLIDAGASLKIDFLSWKSITSSVIAEFHRNTLITAPQNNYEFGYKLRWFERSRNKTQYWRNIIVVNLKYVRNQIYTTNAFATTINWTWYNKKRTGIQLNRPVYLSNYKYTYNLNPYIGSQYQQLFESSPTTNSGSIVRILGNLSGSIAINKKYDTSKGIKSNPPKNIELFADFTARDAFVNSTHNNEGYTKLFKTGLNYYFINTPNVSVSLGGNYNLGSDPLNGLKPQQYWLIAFQVQI
jgi:hypothetical protein